MMDNLHRCNATHAVHRLMLDVAELGQQLDTIYKKLQDVLTYLESLEASNEKR